MGQDSVEAGLLALARVGDEGAFAALVEPHRKELQAYCYRMLGSAADAEDAVQNAMLRAWRGLENFEGRASVRSWLYSIATNTALDVTRHRSRRELPVGFGPAASAGDTFAPAVTDPVWLEPCPDSWLPQAAVASPEARYEQRESVELAFMIMLQAMPPLQRAVLVLRDVMGFSAAEVAVQLGTTAASVNSALQRARSAARLALPACRASSASCGRSASAAWRRGRAALRGRHRGGRRGHPAHHAHAGRHLVDAAVPCLVHRARLPAGVAAAGPALLSLAARHYDGERTARDRLLPLRC